MEGTCEYLTSEVQTSQSSHPMIVELQNIDKEEVIMEIGYDLSMLDKSLLNQQTQKLLHDDTSPRDLLNQQLLHDETSPTDLLNQQTQHLLHDETSPRDLLNQQTQQLLHDETSPRDLLNQQTQQLLNDNTSPTDLLNQQTQHLLHDDTSPTDLLNQQTQHLLHDENSPTDLLNQQTQHLLHDDTSPRDLLNQQTQQLVHDDTSPRDLLNQQTQQLLHDDTSPRDQFSGVVLLQTKIEPISKPADDMKQYDVKMDKGKEYGMEIHEPKPQIPVSMKEDGGSSQQFNELANQDSCCEEKELSSTTSTDLKSGEKDTKTTTEVIIKTEVQIDYSCYECGTLCDYVEDLISHHKKKHSRFVQVCDICGAQFKDPSSMHIHAKHAHGEIKIIKCVCNRVFENVKKIKAHYETCKIYNLVCKPANYRSCPTCSEQFSTQSQYNRHMAKHRNTDFGQYQCVTCGSCFLHQYSLKSHIKNVHSAIDYYCPFCSKLLRTNKGLLYHIYNHKEITKTEATESKTEGTDQYKCPVCEHMSHEAVDMRNHILIAHNLTKQKYNQRKKKKSQGDDTREDEENMVAYEPKDLTCEICGRVCANRGSWLDHMSLHAGEVTVMCQICDRGFVTRHAYRRHMRVTHDIFTGSRRPSRKSMYVNCEVCDSKLCRTGLQKHMDIHNGVFRHQCNECDKKCRTRHDLTVHKRTHTGEKPFQCDKCNKLFSDQANLRHHQKGVHKLVIPRIELVRKTGFHKPLTAEEEERMRAWEIKRGIRDVDDPMTDPMARDILGEALDKEAPAYAGKEVENTKIEQF